MSRSPARRRAGALALALFGLSLAGAAHAATVQQGGLRISAQALIEPNKLPRKIPAPIAVFLAGHIATPTGAVPPQLQKMKIEVNRHGLLQAAGLPACPYEAVRATSTARALSQCGSALIGSGRFWATIVLPDQRPYPTRGRLLVFNGKNDAGRVLFAHIYTTKPFATSFVISFAIRRVHDGSYGTELTASLPEALGTWGFVNRIKLTLRRRYAYRGVKRSYFNSACPAPGKTRLVAFPLARASFYFKGRAPLTIGLVNRCRVAGP